MVQFCFEIIARAVFAAWADMGTNGLGWFIGIGSPVGAAVLSIAKAPRRHKWLTFLTKWRSELKQAMGIALAALVLIACWEAMWNIPHTINRDAQITPHFRDWPPPPAPPLAYTILVKSESVKLAKSLNDRSQNLASQIFDFVYSREGPLNAWHKYVYGAGLAEALQGNPNGTQNIREKRRAILTETRDQFNSSYRDQLVSLEDDLRNAGVEISPVSSAVAKGDFRRTAIMLSVIADRIGKKPPFQRVITPLELKATFGTARGGHAIVYADLKDSNSMEVADKFRKYFSSLGWEVNARLLPVIPRAQQNQPTGIVVIYPSADLTIDDDIVPTLQMGELKTSLEVRNMKQPPTVLKIEVWPDHDEKYTQILNKYLTPDN